MRVVLDTNLLVSYLLTQGETMSGIVDAWEQERFVVLASPAMLAELRDVLQRPRLRRKMTADPAALLDLMQRDAVFVPGDVALPGVTRDPKDDKFVACAVEGGADFIVSGDGDLLDMERYEDIEMIRPHQFLQMLSAK